MINYKYFKYKKEITTDCEFKLKYTEKILYWFKKYTSEPKAITLTRF